MLKTVEPPPVELWLKRGVLPESFQLFAAKSGFVQVPRAFQVVLPFAMPNVRLDHTHKELVE